jgi:hypothetical protein
MGKVLPEELIFTQLIKKFPALMEPEFNSSSLEPVTGTCPEPVAEVKWGNS